MMAGVAPEIGPGAFPPLPADFDLSRFLTGGGGPVNWEIATFLAVAMAGDADAPPRWSDVEDEYAGLVRAAEVLVGGYTGLSPGALLTPVEVVSRARWAETHVPSFRPLVEPLAAKMAAAVPPGGNDPMANLMRALTPFLLGAQAGLMAGYLSHVVLGQYDVQLPSLATGSGLVFVAPNLEAAEVALNVVPQDFKFWIALHEVTHAYEFSQPGVADRFSRLMGEVVDSLEVDADRLTDMEGFDPADPGSLQAIFERPTGLLGAISNPAQEAAMDRIQAFMAVIEGYAEHVMHTAGAARIGTYADIEAAIARRAEEPGEFEDLFQQALGFSVKRRQYEAGRNFCDTVVAAEGVEALNRVWRDESAWPEPHEVGDPGEWLARTVGRRG